jgi:hypothetical protein
VSESVSVELLDDGGPVGTDEPPADRRPRRRLGLVLAVLVVLLVALVAWPDGTSTRSADRVEPTMPAAPAVPAPTDPRLLPWPGVGPLASDEDFVAAAEQAWRTQAPVRSSTPGPGEQVVPLWAGFVGTAAVALLQSVGEDDVVRVAQVSEARRPRNVQRGPLVLQQVETLSPGAEPPSMIALVYPGGLELGFGLDQPGAEIVQVLPAPGALRDGSELLRREGTRFAPVGLQADGLSQPWLHTPGLSPEGPLVITARIRGPEPGIGVAQLLPPGSLLPRPAPVQLVEPAWGRTRDDLPEDYLDASAALAALGLQQGQVAVLGSTVLQDGRVVLLQVMPSPDAAQPSGVVTVFTRGGQQYVSASRPALTPQEVVVGAVRTPSGHLVVGVAAPPEASTTVVAADGEPLGVGPRVTAVALDPGRPVTEVAGQAYREDETYLGRTALDVSGL